MIYRTASLLRPPPPPIFGRNYCKGLFYLHYTPPPPPAGRSSRFAVLQFCTCTRVASVEELYLCIKRVENSTWPTTLPSFSTATACRSKEFSSSTALQSTRIRGRGGGGLTARRKRKSSLLRPPPPLFFLKVGRKRGGCNSGAVR